MKRNFIPPLLVEPRTATVRGLGLVAASALCGTVANALVRSLSVNIDPFVIAFFRSLGALLLLSTMLIGYGLSPLITGRIKLHFLRGLLVGISIVFFYKGLSLVPLAKATAINLTAPLFTAVLAIFMLGETVRIRRISALGVGFVGMLVILRPGLGNYGFGETYLIVSSFVFSFATILLKSLSRTESTLTVALYACIFMIPVTFIFALPAFQFPSPVQLAWLALISLFSVLSQLLFVHGVRQAEVTAVAPVGFIRLLWAALVGYLAFSEVPDSWTWFGSFMVVSAIIYIAWRERN
jgi:drug/metabolite transporter (DMT)-like permease